MSMVDGFCFVLSKTRSYCFFGIDNVQLVIGARRTTGAIYRSVLALHVIRQLQQGQDCQLLSRAKTKEGLELNAHTYKNCHYNF